MHGLQQYNHQVSYKSIPHLMIEAQISEGKLRIYISVSMVIMRLLYTASQTKRFYCWPEMKSYWNLHQGALQVSFEFRFRKNIPNFIICVLLILLFIPNHLKVLRHFYQKLSSKEHVYCTRLPRLGILANLKGNRKELETPNAMQQTVNREQSLVCWYSDSVNPPDTTPSDFSSYSPPCRDDAAAATTESGWSTARHHTIDQWWVKECHANGCHVYGYHCRH